MIFEWDEAKANANLRKHGVSFPLATEVFDDPYLLIEEDRDAAGEFRGRAIGMSRLGVLFVVFIDQAEAVTRIISARKATAHERKAYHSIP